LACTVLLVDDDPDILRSIGSYFERTGYDAQVAKSGAEGLELYETQGHDVVVLDLQLPDQSGLEVLEQLRTREAAVVLLTGHGDIETAVRAMQLGAEDFLTKPVDMPHLSAVIDRAAERVRLRREVIRLRGRNVKDISPDNLGVSPGMQEIARQIELISESDRTTVLLTGESGTGKGWVARMIHSLSPRADRPFVDINCGGLSATFLDSELFGHEKGAFTDAKEMKRGLFEVADGGALFLDEVGDLALPLQPKLLRVLESKSFRRIGGTRERTVDVRLIAASNRDLDRAVSEGAFREDLYYRITVAVLRLPPLRERSREDRISLLERLLADLSHEIGAASPNISSGALDRLVDYGWPGNVREMRNALERALIMARGNEVLVEHLPPEMRRRSSLRRYSAGAGAPQTLEQIEKSHIERTLSRHGGNRTHAARELGISRVTLIKKIQKYGLSS
jgi:DNA-binding NtrC family response regulator